jgi:hypothetical protein
VCVIATCSSQVLINVLDFGVPANRSRRGTVITNNDAIVWDAGRSLQDIKLLYRQNVMDGDVFFNAPEDEVMVVKKRLAAQNFRPPNSSWQEVLPMGCKGRLLRYKSTSRYVSLLRAGKTRSMNIDKDPQDPAATPQNARLCYVLMCDVHVCCLWDRSKLNLLSQRV